MSDQEKYLEIMILRYQLDMPNTTITPALPTCTDISSRIRSTTKQATNRVLMAYLRFYIVRCWC